MESFSLTCTTCKTRLKVRDASVIGQIMACPKCGGMIMVTPPGPATPGVSDSQAAGSKSSSTVVLKPGPVAQAPAPRVGDTGETKPDLSHPLRAQAPINAAAPLKADAFDDVDVLLGDVPSRTMVPTPTVRHAPAPNTPPLPPVRPEAQPTPVQAFVKPSGKKDPDSQAVTQSQNAIPVANQPTAKVISQPKVSSGITHTAAQKPSETPQRAAAAIAATAATVAPSAAAAAPVPEQPAEAAAPGTLAGSPWQYWAMVSASGLLGILLAVGVVALTISWFSDGTKPIAPSVAQKNNPPSPNTAAEANPTVTPSAVPANPEKPAQPVAEKPVTPANNPAANVPATPTETPDPVPPLPPMPMPEKPAAPPAIERDPLGLTDPAPAVKPPANNPLANDPLGKFADLLPGATNDEPRPNEPKPEQPKPVEQPALPPVEEEQNPSPTTKLPKPQPRNIDVAARLADPLPGIEISSSPLADFLHVMQDMSTVPITLRPDGLAMVRSTPYNPETPVTWKGSATTMRDAIAGALQPLGLEAKVEADQLIVDVASPQLITSRLAVGDLTNNDERQANDLAALVMAFVAPESWSDEENQPMLAATKSEFNVRQHRTQLAECFVLLEKLRKARGKPLASRFDPKLFDLTTRSERAKTQLATPITLNYSIPTSLGRVTDRLGKEAKVRILFDWQSLSAAGWNPDAEATLTVEKQPLSAALSDLTGRMDLTWRVVDAHTIQILSPQTQAERVELEFYPVKDLAANATAAATLIAKIRTTLGGQTFRDAGGHGDVRYDEPGQCLIVSVPQPQQLQVAALLKSLRGN